MTRQRATILEVVRSDKCHYTAEEIFERARERLGHLSLATVYNNLHALEREGLTRRITGDDGTDRYDSSYIPHGHFLCTLCGDISDFNLPDFADALERLAGCGIDSYELKVRYVCPGCRKSANKTF